MEAESDEVVGFVVLFLFFFSSFLLSSLFGFRFRFFALFVRVMFS